MTYVASINSAETRTTRISRLEAMIFLGGTVGPFLSGSLLDLTGHGYAFIYMMIAYALAFFYAILFVKEVHETEEIPEVPPSNPQDVDEEQRSGLLVQVDLNLKNGEMDNLPDVARSALNKYQSVTSEGETGGGPSGPEDSFSTAPSDDEQRNIIERRGEEGPSSCCSTYFGSHHCISALKTVFKKREGGSRLYLILSITAAYIAMMITAGRSSIHFLKVF